MGQYFKTANLDKKEYLDPHKLGEGLKLREQLCGRGGIGDALIILLASSNGRGGGDIDFPDAHTMMNIIGRWAGDRIVVLGDYTEDKDFETREGEPGAKALYGIIGEAEEWVDITDSLIPLLEHECDVKVAMTEGWRRKAIEGEPSSPRCAPDIVITTGEEEPQEEKT